MENVMRIRLVWLCLAIALRVTGATESSAFKTIHIDTFEYPIGALPPAMGAWEPVTNTGTDIEIAKTSDTGNALRLIDDHSAASDATCRLRLPLATQPGQVRVSLNLMMTKGACGGVSQDMGLHLFGGGVLLDVFFSKGELKTWQGTGWASLTPPVTWEDGRWYRLEIIADPAAGWADIRVDGLTREVSMEVQYVIYGLLMGIASIYGFRVVMIFQKLVFQFFRNIETKA